MAFFPVLSFLLLLAFGSVDSWAACTKFSNSMFNYNCHYFESSNCKNSVAFGKCSNCNAGMAGSSSNSYYCVLESVSVGACDYWGDGSQGRFAPTYIGCDTQCEADSVQCAQDLLKYWDSANCECKDFTPDTTYFCENAGQTSSWTGGSPLRANVVTCIDGDCNVTATLAGTCQDWGFCPEGVNNCEISKDSTGRRPCTRSGPNTTSGTVCYYQCVDGRKLRCRPTSTQEVGGRSGQVPT